MALLPMYIRMIIHTHINIYIYVHTYFRKLVHGEVIKLYVNTFVVMGLIK